MDNKLKTEDKEGNHNSSFITGLGNYWSLIPVNSNQKMNAYLKEISDLCDIDTLNTHKARRTFASTVTLANDVPIHVVKELLGHCSVQQTEAYAVTEQQSIGERCYS